MSGQPAARIGDMLACTTPQATPAAAPHAPSGSALTATGAPTVQIGGKPAARMGDFSLCPSPVPVPNPIMRGAFPVPIHSMPAARMTDQGTAPHLGMILPPCCPTVLIGLAGTTGNATKSLAECKNMSGGRSPAAGSTDGLGNPISPNTAGQSYNNCGVESARQIISQGTGVTPSQEGLLSQSITSGLASQPALGTMQTLPNGTSVPVTAQNQAYFSGGTNTLTIASIMTNNGVPATTTATTATVGPALGDIETALSQGKGVVAPVNVKGLPGWGSQTGGHAVTVTGFEYDDNGKITSVIYNDTGIGACQQRATPTQFQNAMDTLTAQQIAKKQTPMGFAVTNNPVW